MDEIRDMLFVKALERIIGRPLTDQELSDPEFKYTFSDGSVFYMQIPRLKFPHDLLTKPEDFFQETVNVEKVA